MTAPRAGSPPGLYRRAALGEEIFAWYERVYGERLKIDFSLDRAAIDIGGDHYTVRIPKAFGDVRFILSRTFVERPVIGSHEPITCNVLQLVDDLSEARAASLSDATLHDRGGLRHGAGRLRDARGRS